MENTRQGSKKKLTKDEQKIQRGVRRCDKEFEIGSGQERRGKMKLKERGRREITSGRGG